VSTVILGATKTTQLSEDLKAIDMLPLLTAEVQQRIELVLQNKPELPKW
jgi:aryl-alcohol dehydrogenase-like predicted oxidoreductase